MSATALPEDMWDTIVRQLPPPGPKIVPCIVFYARPIHLHERKRQVQHDIDELCWTSMISKAIHQEEKDLITGDVEPSFRNNKFSWDTQVDIVDVNKMVSNALMLGWDFASDYDRKNYDELGRTFRLVKKQ